MTGEIGFINLQNLTKLPVLPATEEVGGVEETKEVNKDSQHLPQFEEDGVYKTLYGHQENCLGLQLSDDGKHLVSCDTLKKVNATCFPNVFNLQSVFLEHTRPLAQFVVMRANKIASLSEFDNAAVTQDLFVSGLLDGKVKFKTAFDKKVAALAYSRIADQLIIQHDDNTLIVLSQTAFKPADGELAAFNTAMVAEGRSVFFCDDMHAPIAIAVKLEEDGRIKRQTEGADVELLRF